MGRVRATSPDRTGSPACVVPPLHRVAQLVEAGEPEVLGGRGGVLVAEYPLVDQQGRPESSAVPLMLASSTTAGLHAGPRRLSAASGKGTAMSVNKAEISKTILE